MTTDSSIFKFKPAWWLPDGHSQTLWRKFTWKEKLHKQRERVELDDGDFIDIDWALPPEKSECETITIVLHGLCGCSDSPYVIALQKALTRANRASVAMNFRGCGGDLNRLARAYHSGVSDDLNRVFTYLKQDHPNARFTFIGYSLGANVLLKWLGEIGKDPQVTSAIAVSTPFQLAECSKAMLKGSSQIYGRYFFKQLTEELQKKKASFELDDKRKELSSLESLTPIDELETLWDFDDQITAPLHGFKDAQDYYTQCSSASFIDNITTPTLLIHSRNDPIIPETVVPDKKALPNSVELELYSKGGHVGFISNLSNNWLEQRILERFFS